jgi:hypothetical protein
MGYLDNSSIVVHPQLAHNGFPMDGSLNGCWLLGSKINLKYGEKTSVGRLFSLAG